MALKNAEQWCACLLVWLGQARHILNICYWTYYGLSGEDAIRKRVGRFHRERFSEKRFEENAFYSKCALKWTVYLRQRGSLLIQKAVQKTTKLTQRTVAERTISIRRTVVESTVLIGRAVVRRAVSIRRSLMKGWLKNILQVHKRNE